MDLSDYSYVLKLLVEFLYYYVSLFWKKFLYISTFVRYRGNNTGDVGPQGPKGQKGEKGDSPPQPSPPTSKFFIMFLELAKFIYII